MADARQTMRLLSHIRSRIRVRAGNESGIAVPTAIGVSALAFAVVSAALIASVDVQRGSTRDAATKRALAAADGGASVAILRQNKLGALTSSSAPCLGTDGSGVLIAVAASADGWCPAVTGTVADGSYSYRVKPLSASNEATVVSTGTAGGVSRRVAVSTRATTVGSILALEGLVGRDGVHLENNVDVRVNVGSNGEVYLYNNVTACGNIRHGVGEDAIFADNTSQCSGYTVTEGNVTLPPPPVPADIGTNNSNFRLVRCSSPNNPAGCQLDTFNQSRTSTVPWNAATRVLTVAENATMTVGGGDYWLCRLYMHNNTQLIMAQGATVRFFFDTPENCGLADNTAQMDIQNNASVSSTGYDPSLGQYSLPGFYLLGSPNLRTRINWENNAGSNEMVIYAPNTDIKLSNNAVYTGAIVGKTIYAYNNVVIKSDAGFVPPNIGGSTLHSRLRYVECTGPTGSPPDANC